MEHKLRIPLLGQPDPNVPRAVHFVGRYALGVDWADAHGSIYPFEALRRECACGACATLAELSRDMVWPAEVTRRADGVRVRWADAHESLYPYAELRALCRCAGCTGGH